MSMEHYVESLEREHKRYREQKEAYYAHITYQNNVKKFAYYLIGFAIATALAYATGVIN